MDRSRMVSHVATGAVRRLEGVEVVLSILRQARGRSSNADVVDKMDNGERTTVSHTFVLTSCAARF